MRTLWIARVRGYRQSVPTAEAIGTSSGPQATQVANRCEPVIMRSLRSPGQPTSSPSAAGIVVCTLDCYR